MGYRKTAFPHGTSKIPRTGSQQESDGQQEEIECEWNRKYSVIGQNTVESPSGCRGYPKQ